MEISAPIQPQTQILGLFILLLCFMSSINLCSCQSNVPLNVQAFYPWLPPTSPVSAPSPAPVSPPLHQPTPTPVSSTPPLPPETSPKPPLHLPPPPPPPPPMASAPPPSSSVSNKAIYTAVGVTAASTLIVASLLFLFCNKYTSRRRGDHDGSGGGGNGGNTPMLQPQTEFARFEGQVRGLIVDENGVDVVYWRKLEGSQKKGSFRREVYERPNSGKRSFNRLRSSTSNNQVHPGRDDQGNLDGGGGGGGAAFPPPFPPLLPPSGRASTRVEPSRTWLDSAPVPQPRQPANLMAIPKEKPPIHVESPTSPTSAAPMVATKNPTSPAPLPSLPPAGRGKNPAPTPPSPTEARELVPSKPPSVPEETSTSNEIAVASSSETRDDQVKLKPLHLEKVKVNTDHSMVSDKTDKSSFRYNGDLMEALFGYVATNRKSPKHSNLTNKKAAEPNPSAKKIILEAQRSQNIAIVLRSLGVSRTELIGSLLGGKGLNSETLQKLAQITPTKEESSQILGYNGDPTRLADAEFFLYHLLKAVPSAFIRANAMLFRLNYDYEVFQLRESQKTLELACSELGIRGVFLKLLEAILKAGNRLNAGTSRGDAKVFSLSTLLKLSEYKSSDGKTTLLHFVVHEVVRNEGRRCVLTRGNSVSHRENRNNSSMSYPQSGNSTISKEEQEREFIKLGLLEVGGLGAELSNVKKAATIHHETLANTITSLTARVAEVQQLVAQCETDSQDKGRFAEEMQGFIQSATEELKAIKDEQTRVMEFVKRTNQYYQSGSSKDKQPLQLFVMVNGFLNMVDQTCVEIARSLQHKKPAGNKDAASSSADGYPTSQQPDVLRTRVTFPRLPAHFLSDKSSSSGSDDEG